MLDQRWKHSLELGHAGERLVAAFLNSRGAGVIPSYDFAGSNGEKAPRLMFADRGLVIPDLDVAKRGSRSWLEVKTYHGPAPNDRERCLVHGIEKRLFDQYLAVERETGSPIWIAVLEYLSGELLVARLKKPRPDAINHPSGRGEIRQLWPCMCRACRQGQPRHCYSTGVQGGVYWPKGDMLILHTFDNDDLRGVRALAQSLKEAV